MPDGILEEDTYVEVISEVKSGMWSYIRRMLPYNRWVVKRSLLSNLRKRRERRAGGECKWRGVKEWCGARPRSIWHDMQ